MSDPQKPLLIRICDALADAITQCQSQAVAVTELCPQSNFDKLTELIIRTTPFKSAITSIDRSDKKRLDAQYTVWVASPGGDDAVAPGIQLVEDIANGVMHNRLQLAGTNPSTAIITKIEILTVYDLERLLTSHVFLSALRVHVIAWYTP